MKIVLNSRIISESEEPFLIAEAGVNYYDIAKQRDVSFLEAAKLMIDEAAKVGADAIKFQTYKAEKLASKYSPAYWDTAKESTTSQYKLFRKFDKLKDEDYRELAKHSRKRNIIFLSTPFDEDAVDLLNDLVPIFKIASADITNLPFIQYIARKGKPIILSTGGSDLEEIREAVGVIEAENNKKIVLLHCVLNYPNKYEDANIGAILHLKKEFSNYLIGYSDHTPSDEQMLVNTTAALAGASVIEKHFTLDKNLSGNDHYHAADPNDFNKLIDNLRFIKKIWGEEEKKVLKSESSSRKYARRSLVSTKDILKGENITRDMITSKRPGTGIPPKYLNNVIGMKTKRKIKGDEVLKWSALVKK